MLWFRSHYIFCTLYQLHGILFLTFPHLQACREVPHGQNSPGPAKAWPLVFGWKVRDGGTIGCFLALSSPTSLPACSAEANPAGGRGNVASKRDVLRELDSSSQAPICCWHLLTVCGGISNSGILLDSAILEGDRQGLCRKCASTGDCQHPGYLIRSGCWVSLLGCIINQGPTTRPEGTEDKM